jgi:23S rRNA (cytosine1962-C5)-methyltransferase
MNALQGRAAFVRDDVFSFLRRSVAENREKYDFIVLDPPAFVKSSVKIKEAVKAYREVNRLSMGLLKPGGLLVTSSCSYHLSREMFLEMLREASKDAQRGLRLLELRSQDRDHPVLLAMPETEYLKCAFLVVD